jgi:hypothetical protein
MMQTERLRPNQGGKFRFWQHKGRVEGCKGDKSQRDQRCILRPIESYIYILEYKESLISESGRANY